MPDPDPTKDQDPTQPEASKEDAPDGTELTDEQLKKAAGGADAEINANAWRELAAENDSVGDA
jgi:hypothetical protein